MQNKTLIRLGELDLNILSFLDTKTKLPHIAKIVFPKAKLPRQSLYSYILKHQRLQMIHKTGRGEYELTNQGRYFLRVLRKLSEVKNE